jgi:hypothetical protein
VSRATAGELRDLTETTGFLDTALWSETGTKRYVGATPLPEFYRSVLDYAVLQVRSGQQDFYGAMRRAVKTMTDNGLRTISYDNSEFGKKPYSRRLDSSVRAAVNGGLQRLSREMAQSVGEKFGADGMEISWHSGARPSHVPNEFCVNFARSRKIQTRKIPWAVISTTWRHMSASACRC